jgi:hypothetical protein
MGNSNDFTAVNVLMAPCAGCSNVHHAQIVFHEPRPGAPAFVVQCLRCHATFASYPVHTHEYRNYLNPITYEVRPLDPTTDPRTREPFLPPPGGPS